MTLAADHIGAIAVLASLLVLLLLARETWQW